MTTGQPPRLSVIIPTYNRCGVLGQTLKSLTAQRFPADDFEVIVTDDGSSDGTAEMVRSFSGRLRMKYRFQEDEGFRVTVARNAGARLAEAPVLAFLDAGTLAGPDFVPGHLAAAAAGSGQRAVIGYCFGYRLFGEMSWLTDALAELEPAQVVQRYRHEPSFLDFRQGEFEKTGFDLRRLIAPWNLFWSMNCSVSADAFWRAGGFDESFLSWGHEDLELGYRLFRGGAQFALSQQAWSIEMPQQRPMVALRQSSSRNALRMLAKHCEPMVELACAAHVRGEVFLIEGDGAVLRAWTRESADLDVAAEIGAAAAGIPPGARVAIFGSGGAIPLSLAPAILLDFDASQLARAVAVGRHAGYQLVGLRTPLKAGSVDVVIITSRLSGLWDRWGTQVRAEARRIGNEVRTSLP